MTTWSNEKKVAEADACSFCKEAHAKFILTDELFAVISKLCKDVETEWQALLIGEERENNVVYMHDYYIPKQTVTSANVTNDECFEVERIREMGIVGGIHSHGNMGVFFSKTDHDCTNTSPIKNNIVVNNKFEFKALKALTLPCGMVKFLDADVVRDIPPILPVDVIRDVGNISKKSYGYNDDDDYGYRSLRGGYESPSMCGMPALDEKRHAHAFEFPSFSLNKYQVHKNKRNKKKGAKR